MLVVASSDRSGQMYRFPFVICCMKVGDTKRLCNICRPSNVRKEMVP